VDGLHARTLNLDSDMWACHVRLLVQRSATASSRRRVAGWPRTARLRSKVRTGAGPHRARRRGGPMVGLAQVGIRARAAGAAVTTVVLAATVVLVIAAHPAAAAGATVDRLTPTFGPVGRVVDISGTGLATATDVTFNSVDAGAPTVIDDSHIRTRVPDGAS